jgi:hypothetical protein
VSHATNTLFISNQSSAGELKQCIMQAYFQQCEDDYSTFLFPSENSTRPNLADTRHNLPLSQKKHAHN